MTRTLINLSSDDKAWLDQEARARQVSMAELVRQAVHSYRLREQRRAQPTLQDALNQTSGIWPQGDALRYQKRVRGEWEDRD